MGGLCILVGGWGWLLAGQESVFSGIYRALRLFSAPPLASAVEAAAAVLFGGFGLFSWYSHHG